MLSASRANCRRSDGTESNDVGGNTAIQWGDGGNITKIRRGRWRDGWIQDDHDSGVGSGIRSGWPIHGGTGDQRRTKTATTECCGGNVLKIDVMNGYIP